MKEPGRRVLFCWEIGDHHGHVAPYLSLLEGLRDRRWSVTVALSNTAAGERWVRSTSSRLLQAPFCKQAFSGIPEVPFSYAELILGFGFAHAETLAGLVGAWRGINSLLRPNLMITSSAPTAQLAARIDAIPAVRIGAGFNCPPAGNRTPLVRPWVSGIDERLEKSEALCRATINEALRLHGAPAVSTVSEALFEGETLICSYPELDYFGARKERYLGLLPQASADGHVPSDAVDVVAYVRMEHPHTERLFTAIRSLKLTATIYCPDISPAGLARWQGDGLSFSDGPLDLPSAFAKCRVMVSYAGHGTTLRCLLAGKPMLLLPTHLEQQSNASKTAALGAALMVNPDERNPKLKAMLRSLLDEPHFAEAAASFSARHADDLGTKGLEEALDRCERIAGGRATAMIGAGAEPCLTP